TLYADYRSAGLWRWQPLGGWKQLGASDPEQLAAGTNGVYATYSTQGLWRWTNETRTIFRFQPGGWTQLDVRDPSLITVGQNRDGVTDSVYAAFNGDGLWRFSGTTFHERIGSSKPKQIVGGQLGDVYADYVTEGLYRWSPVGGWQQLNTQSYGSADTTTIAAAAY